MSLVFYYAPWSSATTCHWALEELSIPVQKIKLDLSKKETLALEFLALNPNGKVPLLVQDGTPIFESIAILAHLGETFGAEKKLFPGPGIARAQALQWLAWTNVSLAAAAGRYMANTNDQIPADQRSTKVADLAKAETKALMTMIERHLADKTWMVGDSFTFADLHLAGALTWLGRFGFGTRDLPKTEAWLARCCARPALAVAMTP